MKKLTSKLVAFALVAVLAFALTGCFVPTPTTTITFNKLPEATYIATEDAEAVDKALSEIIVTLSDNGADVATGSVAQLEKDGKIVVEGFELKTPGTKTAKIIFGTAVLNFKYTVVAAADVIATEADLEDALKVEGTSVAVLGANVELTKALTVKAGAKVVLDLAEYVISAKYNGAAMFTVEAGAKLEVKNGTIKNETQRDLAGIFAVAGELVVQSGTFTDVGQTEGPEATEIGGELIAVLDGGALTVYGGTFYAKYDEAVGTLAERNYGREAIKVNMGASAKIYGGTFKNDSVSNLDKRSYADGYRTGSYLFNSYGDTFIYNGHFIGARGAVAMCAGSFDVRDGKFEALSLSGQAYPFYTTGSSGAVTGVISGGEFIAHKGGNVLVYAGNASEVEGGLRLETTLVISGGSFKRVDENGNVIAVSTAILGSSSIANVTVTGGEWHQVKATGAFQINCFEEGFTYGDPDGDGIYTVVAK